MSSRLSGTLAAIAAVIGLAAPATGQLRVVQWNISNYTGGRAADIEVAVYGVNPDNGLSMSPDVIVAQEIISSTALNSLKQVLNDAPGSPGDWLSANFVDGRDTDNAFLYRAGRVVLIASQVIAEGGPPPDHPRDVNRYDFRPLGYNVPEATIAVYASHMKAGSGQDDQARRLLEAQIIRNNAAGLPDEYSFMLAGDFNIQDAAQDAYQHLTGSLMNNEGRFFDPINSPGDWNNSIGFRFVHTQDPAGQGGMDDRHDQILASASLVDGDGMDYLGNPNAAYSTTTWNDPNHSYRAWGNDGTSFNSSLRVDGNTMVGPDIAQSIIDAAIGQGHIPVFLDLLVPPRVGADIIVDFGEVPQGSVALMPMSVFNDGDLATWTADGIADLDYTMTSTPGVAVPFGPFSAAAGDPPNQHDVLLDTSSLGQVISQITIASNAIEDPSRVVLAVGEVVAACPWDLDGSGAVDTVDFLDLLAQWGTDPGGPPDFNGDNVVDTLDFLELLANWGPCP